MPGSRCQFPGSALTVLQGDPADDSLGVDLRVRFGGKTRLTRFRFDGGQRRSLSQHPAAQLDPAVVEICFGGDKFEFRRRQLLGQVRVLERQEGRIGLHADPGEGVHGGNPPGAAGRHPPNLYRHEGPRPSDAQQHLAAPDGVDEHRAAVHARRRRRQAKGEENERDEAATSDGADDPAPLAAAFGDSFAGNVHRVVKLWED